MLLVLVLERTLMLVVELRSGGKKPLFLSLEGDAVVMSPAVLLVRPPDKSVCQRLLLLLRPEVLLLLLLLVMEAVAGVRVETVLTTDALENENRTV